MALRVKEKKRRKKQHHKVMEDVKVFDWIDEDCLITEVQVCVSNQGPFCPKATLV